SASPGFSSYGPLSTLLAPVKVPVGMDHTRQPSQQSEQKVQPEGAAQAHLQAHPQRRQEDGGNDANQVHGGAPEQETLLNRPPRRRRVPVQKNHIRLHISS